MSKAKVGVVGYGVIGKRVADAVAAQPDMTLVGVADVAPGPLMAVAQAKGYQIFAASPEAAGKLAGAGLALAGDLPKLLKQVDLVVDCTPPGVPERNMPLYKQAGVKVIVEGGESGSFSATSFSTFANYAAAWGCSAVRVVSCNTTALCRILSGLDALWGVDDVFAVLIRRAADPARTGRGPINALVPALGPSHHFSDVRTCLPQLHGYSVAVSTPQTLSHVHTLRVRLRQPAAVESIKDHFAGRPRLCLLSGAGWGDTAQIAEYYRDLGRPRYDHPEVCIWEDSIAVAENMLCLMYDVHMESVAIPENVDAIRAMLCLEPHPWVCAEMTDRAMAAILPGFAKEAECYRMQKPLEA